MYVYIEIWFVNKLKSILRQPSLGEDKRLGTQCGSTELEECSQPCSYMCMIKRTRHKRHRPQSNHHRVQLPFSQLTYSTFSILRPYKIKRIKFDIYILMYKYMADTHIYIHLHT